MIELIPLAQAEAAEITVASPPVTERVRFVRFLVTGGVAAGVNVISRWLLDFVVTYEVAIVLAYFAGMTTAFILARMFVFEVESGEAKGQFARFALVNVAAFIQVWCVSVGLARGAFPAIGWSWQSETTAHVIGVVSPVFTSYLAHKRFSFASRQSASTR